MIDVRRFGSLGEFENDWLRARYHFSFAGYDDPKRVHWGALRVWNDDTIQPRTGFDPHAHANMEIITYVRQGAISHRDSMGNSGRTVAGDVQVMSAGSGIRHAEYNLEDEETKIFQIWILPKVRGGEPMWGSASFPKGERSGKLVTLASGFDDDVQDGALPIRQDARLLAVTLAPGQTVSHALEPGRHAYLVVARGAAEINGEALGERDGAAIKDEKEVRIIASEETEVLIVDAP